MLDQRRFAGTRVADQADEASVLNGEVDPVKRPEFKWGFGAVNMCQLLTAQQFCHMGNSLPS